MIKVFTKTKDELEEQQNLYNFGAAVAHGIRKEACPYYVVNKNNEKYDINELTADQILGFCRDAVSQNDKAFATNKMSSAIKEAFKLMKLLNDKYDYQFKLKDMKKVIELMYGDHNSSWFQDLLKPSCANKIERIVDVASFIKETKGDFAKPTKEDLLKVTDQMIINEQKRKLAKEQNK